MSDKTSNAILERKCDKCHNRLELHMEDLHGQDVWKCTFCEKRFYEPTRHPRPVTPSNPQFPPWMQISMAPPPPPEREPQLDRIKSCFACLATMREGYRDRPSQLKMAEDVSRALASSLVAVIEAGVGIGKTYAYLIPAFVERSAVGSQRPVLISTKTINLQEQLVTRDLPFISDVLGRLGIQVGEVVLSKGMHHYCCRKRLTNLERSHPEMKADLKAVGDWLLSSEDGDMSEGQFPDAAKRFRDQLGVEGCDSQCPQRRSCTYQRLRTRRKTCSGVLVRSSRRMDKNVPAPAWFF
jgi:hypothetical protein